MDTRLDSGPPTLRKSKPASLLTMAKVSDVIANYRPVKLFRREDEDEDSKNASVLSIDFDDQGDLLMTSHDDETIQIYSVKNGTYIKKVPSKKYGVKLAKFAHTQSCILYASTKADHAIRYLTTHDNSFVRYFKGHEATVTCLAVHPGADNFVSCSKDDTVRIWDANSSNCCGKLYLTQPYLAAFDPSAHVLAIASHACQTILLYDYRNYEKSPFATFDILEFAEEAFPSGKIAEAKWTKIEFSNDGKCLLVATTMGHFIVDAFSGKLKSYLVRPKGHTDRLAPGEAPKEDGYGPKIESSGDVCFTQDGRYVVGGSGSENVYVWDTSMMNESKRLDSLHTLDFQGTAAVLAFNPRYNFFASADKDVVMWAPDL